MSVLSINNKILQKRLLFYKFNQKYEFDYLSRLLFLTKLKIKKILFQKLRLKKVNINNKYDNFYLDKTISKFDLNFYKKVNFKKEKK